MKWHKKGLIYAPSGQQLWAKSHAILPTPELLDDRIRLYLSCCDEQNRGRTTFIDVAAEDPKVLLSISEKFLLDIGVPGSFDDNGALGSSIVNLPDGRKYLYYVGFELGIKIRYRLLTGLAQSIDKGKTFQRVSHTPILERSSKELYFRCGPFVMFDEGIFKLWYVAGSEWFKLNNRDVPVYSIHYLESHDGITWANEGTECFPISSPDEHGFGRPYVVKENGIYKMFYSIRFKNKGYRLGYAESKNGIDWTRKDNEIGLEVSESGWDSEAICFSAVIKYRDKTYLFYNGNDFGRTGIGYATLE